MWGKAGQNGLPEDKCKYFLLVFHPVETNVETNHYNKCIYLILTNILFHCTKYM